MSRSTHQHWIQQVLANESFINYKIEFTGATGKGDGFISAIKFVTVTGTKNGEETQLHLAIKNDSCDEGLGANVPLKPVYLREMKMYQEILPAFHKLQTERKVKDPFVSYIKCYITFPSDNVRGIVLENMTQLGYKVNDIKRQLTPEHLKMILREYGKFHALSFALRDQKPDLYKKLTENYTDLKRDMLLNEYVMAGFLHGVKRNEDSLERSGELELLERYKIMEEETVRLMTKVEYGSDPHAIINHGDCWNNNFMFQFKNQGSIPDNVVFFDWQFSQLAIPVYDLAYFYYSCADLNRLDQLEEDLDIYYNSFSEFLTQLGSDPTKIYPRSLLKEQWKKHARLGLIFAPLSRQLAFVDMSSKDEDEEAIFLKFKINNQEVFDQEIVKLVRHFVDNDFI